ncbi:tripartite tricarboxylate transporter permease [Pararhodobacter sp. CCB-MM2]|uniref:tripartite tricarboxylate transporter permease n=1 Tax=Pararhodobacter sp. CCB-MM2 TaxID=1786003 RepID=UPI000829BEEE|nr:tripartite tricarboxylate transporter permease [Pararhodobacter sp. CCB-MM2]
MSILDHVWLGVLAVFHGPALFSLFGLPIPVALVMVLLGVVAGIIVGATPGLGGPMAMAISLPILISIFGFRPEALLPVMGFLVGVMKGATLGGAVPAILFNTPGTPDAYMTTLDGWPLARNGQAGKALRVAHASSVMGDSFSDLVLILCAPFLAVMVERFLDLPEKAALLILSLTFIAAVMGGSIGKGLISMGLGLLIAAIGTGQDFYPRLTLGMPSLAEGFSVVTVVLGVLVLGEVFKSLEDGLRDARSGSRPDTRPRGPQALTRADFGRILPYVCRSAVIGTVIGALPGIGSTLAATLGYTLGRARHARRGGSPAFGEGAIEGVAATEAANSAVSGANLIPVLSLGIPGNAAAVFLILAADSIGGFNPGPWVFRVPTTGSNPEMVVAFGLFTMMLVANLLNWTLGGAVMRASGIMARIPRSLLLPSVVLVTLTSLYVQAPEMMTLVVTLIFGVLGYLMRRLGISPLPFIIAFILASPLERAIRQAFAATGGDVWFLVNRPVSAMFLLLGVWVIVASLRRKSPR